MEEECEFLLVDSWVNWTNGLNLLGWRSRCAHFCSSTFGMLKSATTIHTHILSWKFHGFERLQISHSHRKPTETERVYVRNTDTANPRCCYDTVNGEGGFARLEYNVTKAICDYYPIRLNYNMIRKNKKSPTLQQSAVFCISPPAISAVIVMMPPIMLIAFYKTSSFAIII